MMTPPTIQIPIVPQWNLASGCVATPDGGFLYVGMKTINYISQIEGDGTPPMMKKFYTRQTIRSLDCDPNWSKTKYFAILAQDNSVQIWDFDQEKAVFGHKAHFTKRHTEDEGPSVTDVVHMGFMANRNILSICGNDLVIYCVASNTYCRRQRIIPKKYSVTVLKCSPFNAHFFAVGTQKGLVILADLEKEQVLYTLRGHDTCITSITWNVVGFSGRPEAEMRTPQKPHQNKVIKQVDKRAFDGADDIFDIYDYDYLENEFGIPCDTKQNIEQFDATEKTQEEDNNTNFNYVEACESLKQEINALKGNPGEFSDQEQVTLEDCQNVEHHDDTSCSCDSNNSVELLDKSSDDCSTNKEKLVLHHQAEVHTQEEVEVAPPHASVSPSTSPGMATVIVSASSDASIWVWDAKTGAAYDQLKARTANHGKNSHIEAIWINSTTLLVTSRSGTITSFSIDNSKPGKFKEDAKEFPQQGVVSLCRSITVPLLWTISSHREITCLNLETSQIFAKYSCASTNIMTMRERPDDMNKIAIAFSDSRIGVMDVSKMTPTSIAIENYTNKIDSQVYSLVWGPNTNYLAFGTNEGRVGILRVDSPKDTPFLFHPVSGKPIYSIDWKNKYIYVCCNERVALYRDDKKNKDPYVLEYITGASAISVCNNYLFVGTQNGYIKIFKQKENSNLSYDLIRSLEICPRYVTEISWSPISPSRFAVASMSRKIRIFDFNELDGTASLIRDVVIASKTPANACVKWSNRRDNLLLASGFDGSIRVWDLDSPRDDELFLKQFSCPMLCALFLPSDEDIIMCAGRNTSIEMINKILECTQKHTNVVFKKQALKSLDGVQWGTKITSFELKTKSEKRRKKRDKADGGATENVNDEAEEVSGMLTKLQLEEKEKETALRGRCKDCKDSMLSQNPTTVFYLTTKEIYKDNLERLNQLLESPKEKHRLLTPKLFGNQADAKRLLEEEIQNHQNSVARPVSSIIAHQINSNLQQEILKRIESKTLTEWHVSLAPSVSYMFWKKCCQAYVNQLLEKGHALQAATYLIALHDVKQAINMLLEKQYFKEALIMAKIHCQPEDKVIVEITDKWINYFVEVGNLVSAAYVCAAGGQFHRAHNVLCKTRNVTAEIQEVLDKLREKSLKI